MKRILMAFLILVLMLQPAPITPARAAGDISISTTLASGFTNPVQLTHAGDASGRIFVVEKPGRVKIIQNGVVRPTPFLDLTSIVDSACGECGLLGVAFHPNYETNGYFYINYTDLGNPMNTVIARYTVSAGNPNQADPASRQVLLTIPQPYENHNGGQLLFGPDGYLYIGMGDGGSGGDPQNNAQNVDSLLGKMLRLDVNSGTPYGIPADNPLVGQPGRDEIWQLGLRNPWRFSFDRLTGDLYIGDVGQGAWEEVDFEAAASAGGKNLGWRCMEGTHPYSSQPPCDNPAFLSSLIPPIAEYSHTDGISITGGFVYRGSLFPNLAGRYFYADFGYGKIWSLTKTSSSPLTFSTPVLELDGTGISISGFGEDEAGELYVLDFYGGSIRKLESTVTNPASFVNSRLSPAAPNASVGQIVTYTIQVINSGGSQANASLLNPIPLGLTYQTGSVSTTGGTATYNLAQNRIQWTGIVTGGGTVTITYQVQVDFDVLGSIINRATLSSPGLPDLTLAASLSVPTNVLQTVKENFDLPGTQPGDLNTEFQTSLDCDTCHSAPIYDAWRGSPMSQAGRDPLLWAALSVANAYAPNAGDYCLRCHTPRGWLANRSSPADGSSLLPEDIQNGVACLTCHRAVDPIASANDEAASLDAAIRSNLLHAPPTDGTMGSAMLIIDPNDNRRGPFDLPPAFPYHSAYQTDFLGRNPQAIGQARICGSCHNLSNPILEIDPAHANQYWPNPPGASTEPFDQRQLFPIERTFDEWMLSEYATGANPQTCQDCHMPGTTGYAADPAFNPIFRDCQTTGCLAEHTLQGANTWLPNLLQSADWRLNAINDASYLNAHQALTQNFLQTAASLSANLGPASGGSRLLQVTVTNQTGHKLPTGYPEGRRMWLHVQAFDASNNLVYESGAYDPLTATLSTLNNPKIYEARLGMTPELSTHLGLPNAADGSSFFFVLNNRWVKDNRIPPRGYDAAAFDQDGLRPVMDQPYPSGQYWDTTTYTVPAAAEIVTVTLNYQVSSREYIEFLKQYGGLDGEALFNLWQQSKSPPSLVATTVTSLNAIFLPVVSR